MAALYLAWVGASRFASNRPLQRAEAAAARAPVQNEPAGLRITQFYAASGEIDRGDPVTVCYGVENARAVQLDPPVAEIEPSRNRCLPVAPERTTTFRLTASDESGNRISEAFTVKVNPAPPRIVAIDLSSQSVKRGQPVMVCVEVRNALSVRLDPPGFAFSPDAKSCRTWIPVRPQTYTLTATGSGGRTDRERFTIRVKW